MGMYERSVRNLEREVDAEASRLVEDGVPPFQAMQHARRIVRERRQLKASEQNHKHLKALLDEAFKQNIG